MEAGQITGLSYAVALGAGLVSFLSPCVLPIVPGYLAMITGLDVAAGGRTRAQMWGILRDTGLFVGGFSAVFVALGLSATALGGFLFDNQLLLTRLSGALVLAMALFLLGSLYLHAPWLYAEKRFHPDLGRFGRAAPPIAGAAFGFGWKPCIGPVLGSILALAASSGSTAAGGTLLATYSAGLGVPFLVTGLAFGRVAGALTWVRRRLGAITLASSVTLAFFGVLLISNRLIWSSCGGPSSAVDLECRRGRGARDRRCAGRADGVTVRARRRYRGRRVRPPGARRRRAGRVGRLRRHTHRRQLLRLVVHGV